MKRGNEKNLGKGNEMNFLTSSAKLKRKREENEEEAR